MPGEIAIGAAVALFVNGWRGRKSQERIARENRELQRLIAEESRESQERISLQALAHKTAESAKDREFQERMQRERMGFDYALHRDNMKLAIAKTQLEHLNRMKELEASGEQKERLEKLKHFLGKWPLSTVPDVLRDNQDLGDGMAALRVMVSSDDAWFTKKILPSVTMMLEDVREECARLYGVQDMIITDENLAKPGQVGVTVETIKTVLKGLPAMVLDFVVREEVVDVYVHTWGLGADAGACKFRLARISRAEVGSEAALKEEIASCCGYLLGVVYDSFMLAEYGRVPIFPAVAGQMLLEGTGEFSFPRESGLSDYSRLYLTCLAGNPAPGAPALPAPYEDYPDLHIRRFEYALAVRDAVSLEDYGDMLEDSLAAWVAYRTAADDAAAEGGADAFVERLVAEPALIRTYVGPEDWEYLDRLAEARGTGEALDRLREAAGRGEVLAEQERGYGLAVAAMDGAGDEEAYLLAAKLFGGVAGFKDANAKATRCRELAEAARLAEERRREQERLDGLYAKAKAAMDGAKDEAGFLAAAGLFEGLGGHGDSAERAARCRELAADPATGLRAAVAATAVGGTVEFGRYPQDGDAPEPIEWRVLSKKGGTAVLVSRRGLDCRPFNAKRSKGNKWETSDLRAWLQGEFARDAGLERVAAGLTCLSVDEAEKYFKSDKDRICKPTGYAKKRGAWTDSDEGPCHGACWWWLRSPGGRGGGCAAFVNTVGWVNSGGVRVDDSFVAVRPALKLNL